MSIGRIEARLQSAFFIALALIATLVGGSIAIVYGLSQLFPALTALLNELANGVRQFTSSGIQLAWFIVLGVVVFAAIGYGFWRGLLLAQRLFDQKLRQHSETKLANDRELAHAITIAPADLNGIIDAIDNLSLLPERDRQMMVNPLNRVLPYYNHALDGIDQFLASVSFSADPEHTMKLAEAARYYAQMLSLFRTLQLPSCGMNISSDFALRWPQLLAAFMLKTGAVNGKSALLLANQSAPSSMDEEPTEGNALSVTKTAMPLANQTPSPITGFMPPQFSKGTSLMTTLYGLQQYLEQLAVLLEQGQAAMSKAETVAALEEELAKGLTGLPLNHFLTSLRQRVSELGEADLNNMDMAGINLLTSSIAQLDSLFEQAGRLNVSKRLQAKQAISLIDQMEIISARHAESQSNIEALVHQGRISEEAAADMRKNLSNLQRQQLEMLETQNMTQGLQMNGEFPMT